MTIIMPSGSYYCFEKKCGLFFWGANGHDAIWHLAIVAVSFSKFPFIMPNFQGTSLGGYNIFLDLVIYLLSLLKISPLVSYFKLIPIIWFFLFTVLVVKLARTIKDSKIFVIWLLFFSYFGSSFTYIFTLFHKKTIWGSSSLISMQSGQMTTNMQYALSLIFILLILLVIKSNKQSLKTDVLLGVLIFINLGLKFYGGVISIIMVCLYYLFEFIKSKLSFFQKVFFLVKKALIIIPFVSVALLFFYNLSSSLKLGSGLIFSPFTTVHPIIEEPLLFYSKKLADALHFYKGQGISLKLFLLEIFSFFLIVFFGMGVRVAGLVYLLVNMIKKKINSFDLIIFLTILLAIFFSYFFIQRGMWWNTVQFYYYALFLLNIYLALFLSQLDVKKISTIFVFIITVLINLPANIDILHDFTQYPAPVYIPKEEIEALKFLKNQPEGIVFTLPYDRDILNNKEKPQALFAAVDSSYVPALSEKQIYLGDLEQLKLTNVQYEERLKETIRPNCEFLKQFRYLYFIHTQKGEIIGRCSQLQKQVIYDNFMLSIYSPK